MKILLVEDEQKQAEALKYLLDAEGYAVDVVSDGAKALVRISLHRTDYDLVILDLGIPTVSGLEVCRQMREKNIVVPVLVLSARTETDMKVQLLSSGADDYLVKPFSFTELNARIGALMRRPKNALPQVLRFGEISLDPNTRCATRSGRDISLTLKEYGLLEYFMRHPNQVVNREDLLTHLWDFNYEGFSNVVDVHIKNLRNKLDGKDSTSVLETVRGIGYRLHEEVMA